MDSIRYFRKFMPVVLLFLVHFIVLGQKRIQQPVMQAFVDMLCFESDSAGTTATNIYIQIPYSEVTFMKSGDTYKATVDIAVALKDSQKLQWSKTRRMILETADFSSTVSTRRAAIQQLFTNVKAGNYTLELSLTDIESGKTAKLERQVIIPDFETAPISISNIMLVSRATKENGRINIVPNFSGKFLQDDEAVIVFFEIYSKHLLDSVLLRATFLNEKEDIVDQVFRTQTLDGRRTQVVWSINASKLNVNKVRMRIELFPLPCDSLSKPLASSSRTIDIQLRGLPSTINDINKAIEQLRYVARPSEIDEMRNAPTEEEKRRLFLEFWKRRDPDTTTPRNELMEEYYDRVAYANQNFTRFVEGWMSDMGMIYIQFGPPDNIERRPFDANTKPYEIWYYYKLNREFVFVDDSGFGDYRLVYPLRDIWGRIR